MFAISSLLAAVPICPFQSGKDGKSENNSQDNKCLQILL
jgi:hypothetical protein